jgi:uncharacterized coiled-coil DUF342 family protein
MRTTAEVAQNARAAAEQACAEADRQALEARAHAEEVNAERDALAGELTSLREQLEEANARHSKEAGELTAELDRARHELDESRSRLLEQQLQARERAQMVDQLRGALATMISERDAARADADEARANSSLPGQHNLGGPAAARHARPGDFGAEPAEPGSALGPFPASPPGHDLGGVAGPPDPFRRRGLPPQDD